MDKPAICIENLYHDYRGEWHIRIPHLELNFGTVYGLVGRNGVGKTSLMNLIAGEIAAMSGSINLTTQHIGHINSQTSYPGYYRIRELAALFIAQAKCKQSVWDTERFNDVLGIFSVDQATQYRHLSTGEKAGCHLAIMLAQHPSIWLLDEPTLGIDVVAINQCLSILSQTFLDDGPCVIFSTHQMYELERMTDRILVLADGEIRWQGETEALHEQEPSFRKAVEAMLQPAKEAQA